MKKISDNNISSNNTLLNELRKKNPASYDYLMRGIEIISRLNEKLFEAYIVGGAVRDILLEYPFHDIDIATNATPQEVMAIFPHGDPRYADLGCITIREDNMIFEITTFRTEEYDSKSRVPTKVHYSKRLIDDISRRDYTISALALTARYNIIDITKKGINDLRCRIVRVIGKGKKRYEEDPIRIFRGLELVAKYRFYINYSTIMAMRSASNSLTTLTHQRIMEEILKIFRLKYAHKAFYYMSQYEIFKAIPEYNEWLHQMIGQFKKITVIEAFAMLFYKLGKIPANTPFTKNEISEIQSITKTMRILETMPLDRMVIYQNSYESLLSANRILMMLIRDYKNQSRVIKKYYKTAYIKNRSELNFKTEDLIKLMQGETGPKVGLIMNYLTKLVVIGELNNNYATLKQEAVKMLTMSEEEIQKIDAPVIVEDLDKIIDPETARIKMLREQYLQEYKRVYDAYIKYVTGYENMAIEDQRIIEKEVNEKTRKTLLETNPEYNEIFDKKGKKKNEKVQ